MTWKSCLNTYTLSTTRFLDQSGLPQTAENTSLNFAFEKKGALRPHATLEINDDRDLTFFLQTGRRRSLAWKLSTLLSQTASEVCLKNVWVGTSTKDEELKASFSRKKGELPARDDKGSTQEATSASKLHQDKLHCSPFKHWTRVDPTQKRTETSSNSRLFEWLT